MGCISDVFQMFLYPGGMPGRIACRSGGPIPGVFLLLKA